MKRVRVVVDGGGAPLTEPFEAVVIDDQELAEITRMKAALREIGRATDDDATVDRLAAIARAALPR
jgi:hypothetical protein